MTDTPLRLVQAGPGAMCFRLDSVQNENAQAITWPIMTVASISRLEAEMHTGQIATAVNNIFGV